jgi:hypothetical protein
MIALVELVVYKMGDLPLKFFGGIVVLQFHNVLQRTPNNDVIVFRGN